MSLLRLAIVPTTVVLTLALLGCGNDAASRELTIGAASSLQPLLSEVVPLFTEETGIAVRVSYGASGTIARQIEEGAPIDVFASADITQVNGLANALLYEDSIFTWGHGLLVIVRPEDGDVGMETLLEADRIAIANPATAPYGAAAKRLMEMNGVWHEVEAKVVFAETALQALLFAKAGEVDLAFVPLSLVRADGDGLRLVDDSLRVNENGMGTVVGTQLAQTLAVVADSASPDDARRFVEFFASDEVVRLFESLGYWPVVELIGESDAR